MSASRPIQRLILWHRRSGHRKKNRAEFEVSSIQRNVGVFSYLIQERGEEPAILCCKAHSSQEASKWLPLRCITSAPICSIAHTFLLMVLLLQAIERLCSPLKQCCGRELPFVREKTARECCCTEFSDTVSQPDCARFRRCLPWETLPPHRMGEGLVAPSSPTSLQRQRHQSERLCGRGRGGGCGGVHGGRRCATRKQRPYRRAFRS
jgi:hypothetical protein